jgi:CDGSH-type Zn-finger protein
MSETPNIVQKAPFVLELAPGKYYWCACGKSKKQPFCDGSHKGSSFTPVLFELQESRKIAFCGCKMTDNKPLCDGTHKKLS